MNRRSHGSAGRLGSAAFACVLVTCICLTPGGNLVLAGNGNTSPGQGAGTHGSGIRVGSRENGHTLTLRPGQTLTVMLKSTFWTFKDSSNLHVLAQLGPVVVVRTPFNKDTCPYGGCGTVTVRYRAIRSGTAQVTATRVSCGEAMGCTGSNAVYQFTVVVSPQRPFRLPSFQTNLPVLTWRSASGHLPWRHRQEQR